MRPGRSLEPISGFVVAGRSTAWARRVGVGKIPVVEGHTLILESRPVSCAAPVLLPAREGAP
jgi:hypothetical protein